VHAELNASSDVSFVTQCSLPRREGPSACGSPTGRCVGLCRRRLRPSRWAPPRPCYEFAEALAPCDTLGVGGADQSRTSCARRAWKPPMLPRSPSEVPACAYADAT